MSDDQAGDGDADHVKLFGDPRSPFVERGPDRRRPEADDDVALTGVPIAPHVRPMDHGHVLRMGRGDGMAAALMVLAVLVLASTAIAGTLILYNAKAVGAFSNPWDSTRVAIGLAVLALGIVHTALLVGVSRAITYMLGSVRIRECEVEAMLHRSNGHH